VIVDPRQDLAKLITLADQALYLAKARGRTASKSRPSSRASKRRAPHRSCGGTVRGLTPQGARQARQTFAALPGISMLTRARRGSRSHRIHDRRDRAGGAASPTPFTLGVGVAGTLCPASRTGGMSSARGIA